VLWPKLVEHVLGKEGVSGSIPLIGSRNSVSAKRVTVGSAADARAYIGLAAGFMETASIGKASTEHEIRNAFSRSYYAIYHVSHGYLLASRTARIRTGERGLAHGTLHSMMERQMGKAFGRFMRECFKLRLDSD